MIAAVLLRSALTPVVGDRLPFISLFAAAAVISWYSGLLAAILAIVVSAATVDLLFLEPHGSFAITHSEYAVGLVLYALMAGVVAYVVDRLQTGRSRARDVASRLALQEALLRVTLSSIGDGVITTDRDGRITFLNPVAEALTGWPSAEAAGHPVDDIFQIVHEFTRARSESPVARVLREGGVVALANHTVLIARDGSERSIEDSAAPILDDTAATIGTVLVFHDASDQRRAEAAERVSAQRLAVALEAGRMGAWEWDLLTDAVWWSSHLEPIHGMERGEFGGTFDSFQRTVHPDDRERVAAALRHAIDTGGEYNIEFRSVRSDGSVHWTGTNARVFRNEAGVPARVTGISMDVSERRDAEEALRAAQRAQQSEARTVRALLRTSERLNSTLDVDVLLEILVQEAVGLVDASGGVAGLATAAELAQRLTGVPAKRAMTVPIVDSSDHVLGFFEVHAREGAAPLTGDDRYKLVALSQAAGIAIQNALAFRRAREAEAALKQADQRKDEFLATLAHELRNPLAPIRNALEVMRLAEDDRELGVRAREMMERQLQHMVRLVDDLLDVSRITRDKLELRRSRITLLQAIENATETAGFAARSGDRQFTLSLPAEPIHLDADLTRLSQVFSNLVHNALKYTRSGGRIWLTAATEDDHVVVCVGDDGVGVAAKDRDRMFELFAQVAPPEDSTQAGLGIGLALARRLVELHGGELTVRSEGLGHGCEFLVTLPLARGAAPQPGTGQPLVLASASGRPVRVLVVDDNRDAAESLAGVLALLGHVVNVALDGVQAVEVVETFAPQVILLDIGMPRMNGYDVARKLRADPATRDVLLVAVTGWGQQADKQAALDAGFHHHLVKPIDVAELERLLGDVGAMG